MEFWNERSAVNSSDGTEFDERMSERHVGSMEAISSHFEIVRSCGRRTFAVYVESSVDENEVFVRRVEDGRLCVVQLREVSIEIYDVGESLGNDLGYDACLLLSGQLPVTINFDLLQMIPQPVTVLSGPLKLSELERVWIETNDLPESGRGFDV